MEIKRVTLINVIFSVLLQIVTIINGLIIPKLILSNFGSNVNGLVSSLTQFLSYVSLIEGGVMSVISANLYKPLLNNDHNKVSSIMKTAKGFYKKIGFIFLIYSIMLAIVYPFFFRDEFDYIYIFTLTLILSIGLLVQYMFSLTLKTLLNADKKNYIVSLTQIVIIIFNLILSFISLKIYPSIHVLKFINAGLYIIQPIVFGIYVKKHYNLNTNVNVDKSLLSSRWDGFSINIAAFIHFGTDVTILTLFTNFEIVSIYSVYALVTTALRQLISSFCSPINATIGMSYACGDRKKLSEKIDIYEFIVLFFVFFLFTTASLLLTPFVLLYTSGIQDANYNQSTFGILLLLSEAIYLLKLPHLHLSYAANKFKDMKIHAYIEALLNVVFSIILVPFLGLIGVAIATIIAMLYRLVYHIYLTYKTINRPQIIYYKKIFYFIVTTGLVVILCLFTIPKIELNWGDWVLHGIVYSIVISISYLILSLIFFRRELKSIIKYII